MMVRQSYLLDVDAVTGATKDQACLHGLGEAASL